MTGKTAKKEGTFARIRTLIIDQGPFTHFHHQNALFITWCSMISLHKKLRKKQDNLSIQQSFLLHSHSAEMSWCMALLGRTVGLVIMSL